MEKLLFQNVPIINTSHKYKKELSTKRKVPRPNYKFFLIVLLLSSCIYLYSTLPDSSNKNKEELTEQVKKINEEASFQNLANKVLAKKELSKYESEQFCELLQRLRGVYISDCGNLSSIEFYQLLLKNSIFYKASVGYSSRKDYRKNFFEVYPELKGLVIVHHAIEQDIINKYPGLFTISEIHSLENLRGVPKNQNSLLHLSQIRKIWNKFYRETPQPSRSQIIDKATEIDNLFGNQFKPTL